MPESLTYVSGTTSLEFFTVFCSRFQVLEAHGSKNGSSFNAGKSREISAAFGC